MKNKLLFITLILSMMFGQKKATTEDGKIVILNEDGTWHYQTRGSEIPAEYLWILDMPEEDHQMYFELFGIGKEQEKDTNILTTDNPLGIWKQKFYVDNFGDYTDSGYISTSLMGKFSNSATTNANLNISFLIESERVSIMLYEYANNHPVKGNVSEIEYDIFIKHNGIKVDYDFSAKNWTDRITLFKAKSITLIDLLKEGGKFQFVINETGKYGNGTYKFTIDDASGFDNALKKLTGGE